MTGFASRSPSHVSTFRTVLLSIAIVAAGAAFAADKAKKPQAAAASPGDRVLTPAQLKACLSQKDDLRRKVDDVMKEKASVGTDKDEIDSSGKVLADELPSLDRTKPDDVDAYNARVESRDKRIDAYQQKVSAYNARAEAARSAQDDYARSCENRRYDDRDLADIQRNKK